MTTRYRVARTPDGSVEAYAVRSGGRWVPVIEVAGRLDVERVGEDGRRGYRMLIQAWRAAEKRFAEVTDA